MEWKDADFGDFGRSHILIELWRERVSVVRSLDRDVQVPKSPYGRRVVVGFFEFESTNGFLFLCWVVFLLIGICDCRKHEVYSEGSSRSAVKVLKIQ